MGKRSNSGITSGGSPNSTGAGGNGNGTVSAKMKNASYQELAQEVIDNRKTIRTTTDQNLKRQLIEENRKLMTEMENKSVNSNAPSKSKASLSVPKDITNTTGLNPMKLRDYADNNGLQTVKQSDLSSLAVGTPVVISNPIMRSNLSSRRDPDGVTFKKGTFAGFTTSLFKRPLVKLDNGKTVQVETDMPYETIFIRKKK